MSSVDSLPPDQRAVLQLVLGRGQSYEQIADLLGMEGGAVRTRAHEAVISLGPEARRLTPERRGEIADWLLGQCAEDERAATREHLEGSAGARAWTRVVAGELSPLASANRPLPDLPRDGRAPEPQRPVQAEEPGPAEDEPDDDEPDDEPEPAEDEPDAEPEPVEDEPVAPRAKSKRRAPAPDVESDAKPVAPRAKSKRRAPAPEVESDPEDEPPAPRRTAPAKASTAPSRAPASAIGDGDPAPASSRVGGLALLVGLGLIVVALVLFLVLRGNGNDTGPKTGSVAKSPTQPQAAPAQGKQPPGKAPKNLGSFALKPPKGGSKPQGAAQILAQGQQKALAIVAQGLQPQNKCTPADQQAGRCDAYAVWLYNSSSDAQLLGYVDPPVGANGTFQNFQPVKAGLGRFRSLVISRETKQGKAPTEIVLQGKVPPKVLS